MTTAPQRFVVRYKKNDGSQHTLQLHAANRQEARIVAMETDAYVRRYPTSVDSIHQAA
jgi:1,2-phenylacetyl-CoA epoxidase PaaB subunit